MKKIRSCAAILLVIALAVSPFAFAVYENVDIYYNDELMEFSSSGAYYDAQADCVMVPLREFIEHIGAKVNFDVESGDIDITIYNTHVALSIGSTEAEINGERKTELKAAPLIYNDITYVPIEAITGSINIGYQWDPKSMSVHLSVVKAYTIGISSDQVKLTFGIPSRSDMSEQGFEWYVYNGEPGQYLMIGIENSASVAYYLYSGLWELECGLYKGMPSANADSLMKILGYSISTGDHCTAYSNAREYIIAYYDSEGMINAVLYEDIAYKDEFNITDRVTASFALELLDLSNVYRTSKGLEPIETDVMLSNLAKKHSDDMGNHNYFAHKDSAGFSNQDRFSAAGYPDCYCGESIAQAYRNAVEAFAGLLRDGDYTSLLSANFSSFGAGVSYSTDSDGLTYFSQVFYAPME